MIVSNTSPLIALSAINSLDLLASLYSTIHIPEAVYREVVTDGAGRPGAHEVAHADWIRRHEVKNKRAIKRLMTATNLQAGESEAIVLAQELGATHILLDERPAREYAEKRRLSVIGTLGILLYAKDQKLIISVKEPMEALVAFGLRIHPTIYQAILRRAGE